MTVYMIDVNYFKEINDKYGHMAGDEILRETSERLKKLFPEGRLYRYGSDEFLIIVFQPSGENHSSDTYEFTQEEHGVNVLLSIGNAKGSPADYHEFFDLISRADKALYVVKKRTHQGHNSRKTGQYNKLCVNAPTKKALGSSAFFLFIMFPAGVFMPRKR